MTEDYRPEMNKVWESLTIVRTHPANWIEHVAAQERIQDEQIDKKVPAINPGKPET